MAIGRKLWLEDVASRTAVRDSKLVLIFLNVGRIKSSTLKDYGETRTEFERAKKNRITASS